MSSLNIEELIRIKKIFKIIKSDELDDLDELKVPNHSIFGNAAASNFPKRDITKDFNVSKDNVSKDNVSRDSNFFQSNKNTERKRKIFSMTESGDTWKNIFGKVFEAKCPICDKNIMEVADKTTWHMGHIQAWSKGGSDDPENIRPICVKCNKSMSSTNLIDYCRNKYPERFKEIMRKLKIEII